MTRDVLVSGLMELGVRNAGVVMVHASLSAFGHVIGGAATLCTAIRDAAGADGTVLMPGFTPQLVHPEHRPPKPGQTVSQSSDGPPSEVFDREVTEVGRRIGKTARYFRSLHGTQRSAHPLTSFLANGLEAHALIGCHPLPNRLSDDGPLGALYKRNALVLMLGVSWQQCTALHLAEYRTAYRGRRFGTWSVPVAGAFGPVWESVEDLLLWEGDFNSIGNGIMSRPALGARVIRVGTACCIAVRIQPIVDFASDWMATQRDLSSFSTPPAWTGVTFR
ncbi:aminoglycoside N(3)-acetyltransferase [Rhizobium ruizarguesonis]